MISNDAGTRPLEPQVAGEARRPHLSRRSVAAVGASLLAVAFAVAGCGGLGENAAGDVSEGPASGEATALVMRDNLFEPAALELPAGAPVTLEIANEGEANHNFTIETLDTSTGPMEPGDVMTVTFTPPEGTTRFVCTWHPEMVGEIVAA